MPRRGMSQSKTEVSWEIAQLGASGPHPRFKKKLALFGQFVGDWDIVEDRFPQPSGKEVVLRGELHVRWILEGRGVQDTFSYIDEKTGRVIPAGTTVRFYDSKLNAWHSVWISPLQHVVQPFIARKVKAEIVMEGKTADGRYPEKWTFFDIEPDSFRWRAEESHDGRRSWTLTEEMKIRRHVQPVR